MRKNVFAFGVLLLGSVLALRGAPAPTFIDWGGYVDSSRDAVDTNVTFTSDIILQGGVKIWAATYDITVTLGGSPRTAQGDTAGNDRLYLIAEYGRTISFVVDDDLTFKGSPDGTYKDLLIAIEGNGTVVFRMTNSILTLTKNGDTGGGVRMYVVMKDALLGTIPTLRFDLVDLGGVTNESIVDIGASSVLGYLSDHEISDTDKGQIIFDPTGNGAFRDFLWLKIEDTGSVLVSPRLIAGISSRYPTYGTLVLAWIIRSRPAGCQAIFKVVNSKGSDSRSGLIIENYNNTLYELLIDPWYDLGARADTIHYNGSFSGIQYGFVLGTNGTLDIQSDAYVDYVALRNNLCPQPDIPCGIGETEPCCPSCCSTGCENNPVDWCDIPVNQVVKKRNPSAFVVDGFFDPDSIPAQIKFSDRSALFFRSGVDCEGNQWDEYTREGHLYVINPAKISCGPGELVFDVEGFLNVFGSGSDRLVNPSKIEILSLEVYPILALPYFEGGPVLIGGAENNFPKRTFGVDANSNYLRYNKAYALINNYVNLCCTWLVHTDVNHEVYENNDVKSEPTYVGGETFQFNPSDRQAPGDKVDRPKIVFYNSTLMVHDDVAFTGVDLLVPNGFQCTEPQCTMEEEEHMWVDPQTGNPCVYRDRTVRAYDGMWPSGDHVLTCTDNLSKFIFYYNGYSIDSGSGRNMILGTLEGSKACDCCTVISKDAHLDVMQYTETGTWCTNNVHRLELLTEANDSTIVENISGPIDNQFSIQTIYLGNSSNISIGSQDPGIMGNLTPSIPSTRPYYPTFALRTHPVLYINGNFFSFETRGGPTNLPETSSITGAGGIFVDTNGTISINEHMRANVSTMVTKSGNGIVILPRNQVFFDSRVGIANWQLNMTQVADRIIIPSDTQLSDYTLNWLTVTKDYANFTPYILGCYSWPQNVTS